MLKIYKVCSDFISHSTAQQGVQVGSGGLGGTARWMGQSFSAANIGRKFVFFFKASGGMFKLKVVGDLPPTFSLRSRNERFHHPC